MVFYAAILDNSGNILGLFFDLSWGDIGAIFGVGSEDKVFSRVSQGKARARTLEDWVDFGRTDRRWRFYQ